MPSLLERLQIEAEEAQRIPVDKEVKQQTLDVQPSSPIQLLRADIEDNNITVPAVEPTEKSVSPIQLLAEDITSIGATTDSDLAVELRALRDARPTDFLDDVGTFFSDVGDFFSRAERDLSNSKVWEAAGAGVIEGVISMADFGDMVEERASGIFGSITDPEGMTGVELSKSYVRMATQNVLAVQEAYDFEPETVSESIFHNVAKIAPSIPLFVLSGGSATGIVLSAIAADLIAFEAMEPRLSDIFQEMGVGGAFTDALVADPTDSHVLNKLRQSGEAFILASVTLGLAVVAREVIKDVARIASSARAARMVAKERKRVHAELTEAFKPEPVPPPRTFPSTVAQEGELNRTLDELMFRVTDEEGSVAQATRLYRSKIEEMDPDGKIWPGKVVVEGADDTGPMSVREKMIAGTERRLTAEADLTKKGKSTKTAGPGDGRILESRFDATTEALRKAGRITSKKTIDFLDRMLTSSSGPLTRSLHAAGPLGRKAEMDFDLMAGATSQGMLRIKEASKVIYGGLNRRNRTEFHRLIGYQRDTVLLGRGKGVTGARQVDIDDAVQRLKDRVGPETYADLAYRADQYFAFMGKELDKMKAAGLITETEFKNMMRLRYEPIRAIADSKIGIDPSIKISLRGKVMTVPSSGIRRLSKSQTELIEHDSRMLMEQFIMRVSGRIARNRANQSLYELATDMKGNGVAALKSPKGEKWAKLSVMIDGEKKSFYINPAFANQWISAPAQQSAELASIISVVSGAALMRTMATGISQSFAVAQFSRDIAYSFLVGTAWSTMPHKAIMEIGADLSQVWKDVALRKGAYIDYINEGGMFSFMVKSAQGANEVSFLTSVGERGGAFGFESVGVARVGRTAQRHMRHALNIMSYAGHTSEMIVRLAYRNRIIKMEMEKRGLVYDPVARNTPPDISRAATYAARDLLPFNKGGVAVKFLDTFMPYLNVSFQSLYRGGRAVYRNPQRVAGVVATMWGASASLWLYNRYVHPEAWKQITIRERTNNWIITTDMQYIDEDGQTRHIYFSIPKDQTTRAITAVPEVLLGKSIDNEDPTEQVLQSIQGLSQLMGDAYAFIPPGPKMVIEYTQNISLFKDRAYWKGKSEIDPTQEFQVEPKRRTSAMARGIGDITGTSPERGGGAIYSLAPKNIWTDAVIEGVEVAATGQITEHRRKAARDGTMAMLSNMPILGRFVKTTYKDAKLLEEVADATEGANTELSNEARELDYLVHMGNADAIDEYIKAAPDPAAKRRRGNRAFATKIFNKRIERLDQFERDLIPGKSWWRMLLGLDPKARAIIYVMALYDTDRSSTGYDIMEDMVKAMNPGSVDFANFVRLEKEKYK